MKKTTLFALLLLLSTFAFARKAELTIGEYYLFEGKDTARSFVILGDDKDKFITGMTRLTGKPDENRTGVMIWRNTEVEHIGNVPLVQVSDGIITHDKKNRTACFVPFTDSEDKQKKLANLQSNQERKMRVEFCDEKGKCLLYSKDNEEICRNFLASAIK